jgi:hypothetical protein
MFAASISNGGTISAGGIGIDVDGASAGVSAVFGTTASGGGIANTGTISANNSGVLVKRVATFQGGISNSGKIIGKAFGGIRVSSVGVSGSGGFAGGISNGGTISGGQRRDADQRQRYDHRRRYNQRLAAAGTLTLSGVTSIGLGATLETLSGGTALLGGTITNSGVLFASGADSFIEILNGSTISGGGIVQIGDGIVDIQSLSDTQNVVFMAGGTGGLEIDDSVFLIFPTTGFGGTISEFGQNVHQFIDLTAVTSDSTVRATYTSTGSNSGLLTVTSGLLGQPLVNVTVAQISFAGQYTTSSFKISSGPGGTVEITDPPATQPGSTGAATSLAFGGHPTLAPFGGSSEVGKNTPVAGGPLATLGANLELLANYMAASFVVGAHGGSNPRLAQELLHTQPPITASPHR